MTDLNTTPPSWATATDIAHPAWGPFLAFMRERIEYPTAGLWTLWHAAWTGGATGRDALASEVERLRDIALDAVDVIEEATTPTNKLAAALRAQALTNKAEVPNG